MTTAAVPMPTPQHHRPLAGVVRAFRRHAAAPPPARLALDLGTARTRVAVDGTDVLLDEPTLLAVDGHGEPVAAGWAAWDAGVHGAVALRYPVRQAHVVHPRLCAAYLRLLLQQAGLTGTASVVVAVPTQAPPYDADVLTGCVAAATGAQVQRVAAGAACAAGAAGEHERSVPSLVLDVGAGVTELSVVSEGRVRAAARVDAGAQAHADDPGRWLALLVEAYGTVLHQLPAATARALRSGPVRLVGGGALVPGLVADVRDALRVDVDVPTDPRDRLVVGLAGHLPAAPGAHPCKT